MKLKTEEECLNFRNEFLIQKGYIESQGRYMVNVTEKSAGCLDNKLFQTICVSRDSFSYRYEREMRKAQFGVSPEEKLPQGVTIRYFNQVKEYAVYKGGKCYQRCSTEEEAIQYAKENLSRKQVRKQSFIPPQLTNIRRIGMDEVVMQPITGQDYMNTFGFYGGEFGNWMTAADRQQSLNMGYEAFHDLAVALEIEDKDISFDGKLAIAFGSRGHSNAAAHYEPLRNVINLTKMNGAGSLAHEWGHALDDLIGTKLGSKSMMTEMGADAPESMIQLIKAMKYKFGPEGIELTDFYKNSRLMDQVTCKCDKGYWASECEMFARAFACYVEDKLHPGVSDYLCGHAESAIAVITNEGEKMRLVRAYPDGEERKIINQALDCLLNELKSKELLTQRVPEEMMNRNIRVHRSR